MANPVRQLLVTKDGSHTVSIPDMNVTYHSQYGAIQESRHVFIETGLIPLVNDRTTSSVSVFEMGFGTGLNALLTLIEAEERQITVRYTTVELHPLQPAEIVSLNYCEQLRRNDLEPAFIQMHQCGWHTDTSISPFFTLNKVQESLLNCEIFANQHLIYFDAFAPAIQPELWTMEIFEKLFLMLAPGGIMVTYCSKGAVRRAMKAAGFKVEKIQGPPGKWEIVRAIKNLTSASPVAG